MEWTTYDLAVHSRYPKQRMKMIWRLPWWFHVGGAHIDEDEEERKSGETDAFENCLLKGIQLGRGLL